MLAYVVEGKFISDQINHNWLFSPCSFQAYLLADQGYDVWMCNARGNIYSRNHTTLNPDTDSKFWDFSWHEIGIYDIPATVDHILQRTNKNVLYYVGHSQGTTVFYVLTSIKPEYNSKFKAFVHLAPVAFMNHLTSPIFRVSAPFEPTGKVCIKNIFSHSNILQ